MELAVPEIGSAEMEGIWPPWHHLPPRSGAISKVIFQVRGLPVGPSACRSSTAGYLYHLGPAMAQDTKGKEVTHQTSNRKRLPAEFKHITKRRTRN